MAIWRRLLGAGDFVVRDDVFDTGGDSLKAVSLPLEIERQFGIRLPFDVIYGGASIEHLTEHLSASSGGAPGNIVVPLQPLGSKTPFFCGMALAVKCCI